MRNMKKLSSFLCALAICLSLLGQSALAAWDPMQMTAPAAILVDTQYNTILFERNARLQRAPASITKVMTALLTLEAIDRAELQLDQVITTSAAAVADITKDSSTQNIQPGEQMSVEELLYCLLCPSANEAANILAEAVAATIPDFVERMNTRAKELGMNDTQFKNPHGLHRDDHYSTAYDIYLMVQQAMKYPIFQKIVSTEKHTVPATNLSAERTFFNTNALISSRKYPGYLYDYATGVKTGNTPEAGYCLASSARYNERTLVAVVLGAQNIPNANGTISRLQFSESRALLRWGITDFSVQTLTAPGELLREVPVRYGKGVSHVIATPADTLEALLPTGFNEENLQMDVSFTRESFAAPIKAGDVLGSVHVSYEGKDYGTMNLVASNDVACSLIRVVTTTVQDVLGSILFWLAVLGFFIVLYLRYRRALKRTPRRKKNANIQHIDSARDVFDTKPRSDGKRPR